MSNEENPEQRHGPSDPYAGWQPTPQGGEYDAEATAFVHLDPDDLASLGSDPLAAPGHGYVPPMILPLTPAAGLDPAATGSWVTQTRSQQERAAEAADAGTAAPEAVHWPDPNQREPYGQQHYPQAYQDTSPGYGQTSSTTAQWNFTEAVPPAEHHTGPAEHPGGRAEHRAEPAGPRTEHPGHHTEHPVASDHSTAAGPGGLPGHTEAAVPGGHSGQWTIPVVDGDLPEDSGEFTASAPASPWYSDTAPATLPGGAPAPWAEHTQSTQDTPGAREAAGPGADTSAGHAERGAPTGYAEPGASDGYAGQDGGSVRQDGVPGHQDGAPVGQDGVPVGQDGAPGHSGTHTRDEEPPGAFRPEHAEAPGASQEPTGFPEPSSHPAEPPHPEPVDRTDPAAEPGTAPGGTGADPLPGPTTEPTGPTEPTDLSESTEPAESSDPAEAADPAEATDPADPAVPADPAEPAAPADVPSAHASASYVLHVNGVDRPVSDAWIGESLLYVLRERLGLAGAKDGCSQGECGACNVQVDGRLVASCLVPAATAAGSEVRTVEGLAVNGEPSDIQRALAARGAVQCGFCIPGMAMTVHDLLEGNHAPSELETRQALCGNLCRCSGYRGVLDAVREVVASRDTAVPEADEPRIPHQAAPGAGSVQAHPHEGDAR
ncbi:2Fe-2S iron-sulfur cluster-binding protein [Streptomyces halstedii]|uniref:2Fe-2S iron-sulfur cluster-binding protein n=1 Tax=Streptomyces halstedii TaxID=1944 RepID=UPI0037FB2F68